ncbi:uncharacterized protein LOC100183340 isoform X2 [Ciona intestinalis]
MNYHPDVVRWAIELFSRSPSAYEHLRTTGVLTLPAKSTIASYRNSISPEPGLNTKALEEIERVVKLNGNLSAYVTLDEMKIRENLIIKNGKLIGFVDFGKDLVQTKSQLASHLLVFYLRSSDREISIPLAWYPTHSTPPHVLAMLFWQLLWECESRGVQIHAVVCDGHPSNRTFFKLIACRPLNVSGPDLYTAINPYACDRHIFLCSDPSHLLKTARNSLFSSKPGGSRYMNNNGDILWTHILSVYKTEQQNLMLSRCRLSSAHIYLNSYTKMKVNLAREVLSWSVGKCLEQIPAANATAKFVLLFAKWFDIMNCSRSNPIKTTNDNRLNWLENDFLNYLLEWERLVNENHPNERKKRLMAQPTFDGLIFSTNNYIALVKQLLNAGSSCVCLNVFSQDVLEAVFGNLRTIGRRSQNPDVFQSGYGLEHITTRKIIKKIKGGNTTFGKKNAWTEVCEEPIIKKKKW